MSSVGQANSLPAAQAATFNYDSKKDQLDIDISAFVKTLFQTGASCAAVLTNSVISVLVGISKLTAPLVVTSLALGCITKPLISLNEHLTKHCFSFMQDWASGISHENERLFEAAKGVASFSKYKIHLSGSNYKKLLESSIEWWCPIIKTVGPPIALAAAAAALMGVVFLYCRAMMWLIPL